MSADSIVRNGSTIQTRVIELDEFRAAETVALYSPLVREVGLDEVLAACRAANKAVVLPAWIPERKSYGLARWDAGAPLKVGHYGIEEPATPVWVPAPQIDFIVVTCLAFDASCHRLGHGSGYFDRLLAGVGGAKVCLAFECQKAECIPAEPHDIRLDLVVTEFAIYRAEGRPRL